MPFNLHLNRSPPYVDKEVRKAHKHSATRGGEFLNSASDECFAIVFKTHNSPDKDCKSNLLTRSQHPAATAAA